MMHIAGISGRRKLVGELPLDAQRALRGPGVLDQPVGKDQTWAHRPNARYPEAAYHLAQPLRRNHLSVVTHEQHVIAVEQFDRLVTYFGEAASAHYSRDSKHAVGNFFKIRQCIRIIAAIVYYDDLEISVCCFRQRAQTASQKLELVPG